MSILLAIYRFLHRARSVADSANVSGLELAATQVARHMARLGEQFQAAAHALIWQRHVTLHSGLLAPGGNIPVAILVSTVLRLSTRGDR